MTLELLSLLRKREGKNGSGRLLLRFYKRRRRKRKLSKTPQNEEIELRACGVNKT